MTLKHYKPTAEMTEVNEMISSTESFENQYVKRYDYEVNLAHAFNEGKRIGGEEKFTDYQTAKSKRIYEEKKVLNSAIEYLKLSLEKLENCKVRL